MSYNNRTPGGTIMGDYGRKMDQNVAPKFLAGHNRPAFRKRNDVEAAQDHLGRGIAPDIKTDAYEREIASHRKGGLGHGQEFNAQRDHLGAGVAFDKGDDQWRQENDKHRKGGMQFRHRNDQRDHLGRGVAIQSDQNENEAALNLAKARRAGRDNKKAARDHFGRGLMADNKNDEVERAHGLGRAGGVGQKGKDHLGHGVAIKCDNSDQGQWEKALGARKKNDYDNTYVRDHLGNGIAVNPDPRQDRWTQAYPRHRVYDVEACKDHLAQGVHKPQQDHSEHPRGLGRPDRMNGTIRAARDHLGKGVGIKCTRGKDSFADAKPMKKRDPEDAGRKDHLKAGVAITAEGADKWMNAKKRIEGPAVQSSSGKGVAVKPETDSWEARPARRFIKRHDHFTDGGNMKVGSGKDEFVNHVAGKKVGYRRDHFEMNMNISEKDLRPMYPGRRYQNIAHGEGNMGQGLRVPENSSNPHNMKIIDRGNNNRDGARGSYATNYSSGYTPSFTPRPPRQERQARWDTETAAHYGRTPSVVAKKVANSIAGNNPNAAAFSTENGANYGRQEGVIRQRRDAKAMSARTHKEHFASNYEVNQGGRDHSVVSARMAKNRESNRTHQWTTKFDTDFKRDHNVVPQKVERNSNFKWG